MRQLDKNALSALKSAIGSFRKDGGLRSETKQKTSERLKRSVPGLRDRYCLTSIPDKAPGSFTLPVTKDRLFYCGHRNLFSDLKMLRRRHFQPPGYVVSPENLERSHRLGNQGITVPDFAFAIIHRRRTVKHLAPSDDLLSKLATRLEKTRLHLHRGGRRQIRHQ